MNNPYLTLGISADAADAEIRQAYLEGIRNFPPDQHPTRFQQIVQAYEAVRDEASRLNYYLFSREIPGATPGDTLAAFCAVAPVPVPLPFEDMKAYLRACTATTT